jgi:hypothetical protein
MTGQRKDQGEREREREREIIPLLKGGTLSIATT